jgi:hypothetical protein
MAPVVPVAEKRVAALPTVVPGPSVLPREHADNIVWGTLAEGRITPWLPECASDPTAWAMPAHSTSL